MLTRAVRARSAAAPEGWRIGVGVGDHLFAALVGAGESAALAHVSSIAQETVAALCRAALDFDRLAGRLGPPAHPHRDAWGAGL